MVINGHTRDAEIILEDDGQYHVISPEATIERCTIRIRVPSRMFGVHGRLSNSTIITEKKLSRFSWTDANLEHCRFVGTFKENEFGTLAGESVGLLRDCVLSDAFLHDCQFFGDFTRSNTFPHWPHHVIFDPHANRTAMRAATHDPELAVFVEAMEYLDRRLRALVVNCESVSKRLGMQVDEVSDFLRQFDFVT